MLELVKFSQFVGENVVPHGPQGPQDCALEQESLQKSSKGNNFWKNKVFMRNQLRYKLGRPLTRN